jgi:hypothetical protein
MFHYNKKNRKKNFYVVPDNVFYRWSEANLTDFYDFYKDMKN